MTDLPQLPTWAWVLVILGGLALATVAHVAFWTWRYTRPFAADERLDVETSDGVRLALWRLRPAPGGPAGGAPVLCCHGVACNGRMFDFEPGRSLGRHLAALGFDVYLIDLRGAGKSGRPRSWDYGFFDYVDRDVPALIARVREQTGARRVLWVGHSMGGLIGFEHLARDSGDADLAALAALGSPLNLSVSRGDLRLYARLLPLLRPFTAVVRLSFIVRLVAPLAGRLRLYPETLFLNPRHTPGRVVRHFLVEVLHDVSLRVLEELVARVLGDASMDGRPMADVRTGLGKSPVPTLVIAGARDHIAPVTACDISEQRTGCDHQSIVLSRKNGAPFNFGHLDLLIGDAAAEQVYAPVATFLLAHATRCETPPPPGTPNA